MSLGRTLQLRCMPILLTVLVACQPLSSAAPSGDTQPKGQSTEARRVPPAGGTGRSTPEPAAAKEPPLGDQVTLEPIRAQLVQVDQVGYLPGYAKVGLVTEPQATSFKIVDVQTGRSVFAGELGAALNDEEAMQTVRTADFSPVTQPGTYTLVVPGLGRSPTFRVRDDVYAQLHADAVASYDLLARLAPPAWQTAQARDRETAQPMDVAGGWPDAGDYGRYLPTAASTLGTLLLLADVFPDRAAVQVNVPGLRPDLPAYLQVLKHELDWMLKMQRSDGAVYHKVTPMGFGGFVRGEDNIGGELFAFEPSTPDAAAFAAVMAEAARVYQSVDGAYARRLLGAAERSWRWLGQHPQAILPADMEGTGGYLYPGDETHRFWAAAELYKTTGDAAYGTFVRRYLEGATLSVESLSWSNTQTFGLLATYFNGRTDARLRQRIADTFRTWADGMTTTVTSSVNPYRVSISEYAWASNKAALDNAVLLLVANQIAPSTRYVECALDQLHYVLGRNILHKSYVTGYGFNPVRNPHNRTMFALGRTIPGVLVGGPNGEAQDGISPPADGPRSYVDDLRAYSANENSIEYNAPLVFLTAFFHRG